MNSRLNVDTLNDEQLERLSVVLSLRKTIRELGAQREVYVRNHEKRVALLDAEVVRTEKRLVELLDGGAS